MPSVSVNRRNELLCNLIFTNNAGKGNWISQRQQEKKEPSYPPFYFWPCSFIHQTFSFMMSNLSFSFFFFFYLTFSFPFFFFDRLCQFFPHEFHYQALCLLHGWQCIGSHWFFCHQSPENSLVTCPPLVPLVAIGSCTCTRMTGGVTWEMSHLSSVDLHCRLVGPVGGNWGDVKNLIELVSAMTPDVSY